MYQYLLPTCYLYHLLPNLPGCSTPRSKIMISTLHYEYAKPMSSSKPLPKRLTLVHIQYTLASTQSQSLISWKNIFTTWNLKHLFPNGCFNWMIPNLYIAKHPFKTGCLGYQAHLVHHTLKRQTSSFSSKSPNCLENDSQVPKHHWSALVALCECVGCLGKFLIRTSYTPVN